MPEGNNLKAPRLWTTVSGSTNQHNPQCWHIFCWCEIFPEGGQVLAQEEPFPTNFALTAFCHILKSLSLWHPQNLIDHLRKSEEVANWIKRQGTLVSLALYGKKEAGKAFDVSVDVEEEVYSVLAQGRCSGNTCPQLTPRQELGLTHILTNVCCDHTWSLPLSL